MVGGSAAGSGSTVVLYPLFNKKPLVPNLLAHTLAHHSKSYLLAHDPGPKVGMKDGWGEVARPPRKRAAITPAFGAGVQPHLQGSFCVTQEPVASTKGKNGGGGEGGGRD